MNPAVILFTVCAACAAIGAGRPPFPEVKASVPLKYHYENNESLYLETPPIRDTLDRGISKNPQKTFLLPRVGHGFLRVLIQSNADKWTISVPAGVRLIWRQADGAAMEMHFDKGHLKVEMDHARFQITGAHDARVSISAPSIRFMSEDMDAPLGMNGKIYRGSLDLYAAGAGFQSINVVSLEDYLRGVVPLEMGRHGVEALEALKAQAVVARTYAYKSMVGANDSSLFDIRGSTQDQVYGGVAVEYAESDRAIRETEGLVVLYGDSLVLCYYHSTCGGMTASRHEVWGGASIPYLLSRSDLDGKGRPWCRASRFVEWTQEWKVEELAGIVHRNLADAGVASAPAYRRLTGLRVSNRFSDGRINTLEVQTDKGSFALHGDKVRLALRYGSGDSMLRSARFDIKLIGDRVIANGSGYGHGVGMCQMGALGRAAAGQTCEQILSAYYPGTTLAVVK